MGLLDGVLGSLVNSALSAAAGSQPQNPLLQAALQLLQQQGGIEGVVGKFRAAGYGAQADSWVATGRNEPISGEALQQALGPGTVRDLAARLGMPGNAAAGDLAALLPQLIDRMTPQGVVNHGADPVAAALAELKQRAGRGP